MPRGRGLRAGAVESSASAVRQRSVLLSPGPVPCSRGAVALGALGLLGEGPVQLVLSPFLVVSGGSATLRVPLGEQGVHDDTWSEAGGDVRRHRPRLATLHGGLDR